MLRGRTSLYRIGAHAALSSRHRDIEVDPYIIMEIMAKKDQRVVFICVCGLIILIIPYGKIMQDIIVNS